MGKRTMSTKGKVAPAKHRLSTEEAFDQLIACGKLFYERQWMWGTAGNLSIKLNQEPLKIAITASGVSKGEMTRDDLIQVEEGRELKPPRPGMSASAETAIHQAVHRALPGCGAVFHVHPIYSTLMSAMYGDAKEVRMLRFNWFEMMKGVGIGEGEACEIAILPNWQDVTLVAKDLTNYLSGSKGKVVPVVFIYNHGLTAWGTTPEQARNHLEIMEFVCQYLYLKRS